MIKLQVIPQDLSLRASAPHPWPIIQASMQDGRAPESIGRYLVDAIALALGEGGNAVTLLVEIDVYP